MLWKWWRRKLQVCEPPGVGRLPLLKPEPGLGFPHSVVSLESSFQPSGPGVEGLPHTICSRFIDVRSKLGAGDGERKKDLSLPKLAFWEGDRHAELPLRFRMTGTMAEGRTAPGRRKEWHPTQLLGRREP